MRVPIEDDSAIACRRLIARFSKLMKAENTSYAGDIPRGGKVCSEAPSPCGEARFTDAY